MTETREQLGLVIAETARAWRARLDERLQPLGLSQSRWLILLHLSRGDGLRQKDLAARVGIEAPTLVGLLDRMTEDGWLERREMSGDRRSKTVHLTPKAVDMLKEIRATAGQLRRELLAGIPPQDVDCCLQVLMRIKQRIER